jgi:hypothetical protein
MCWPLFIPQEDSWYSFLLEAKLTMGPIVGLEGFGKFKKKKKKKKKISTSLGLEPVTFQLAV